MTTNNLNIVPAMKKIKKSYGSEKLYKRNPNKNLYVYFSNLIKKDIMIYFIFLGKGLTLNSL